MTEFVERRRYFRVEDRLEFSCRFLHEKDELPDMAVPEQPQSREIAKLESQIRDACQKVSNKSPEVAEVLALLNRKVSLLYSQGHPSFYVAEEVPREQPVNLSACGIAFFNEEYTPLGTRLMLRMRLKPGEHEITLLAFVISCEQLPVKGESGSYLLRADFSDLAGEQQELLIQHVMQCQNRHLRERRQLSS